MGSRIGADGVDNIMRLSASICAISRSNLSIYASTSTPRGMLRRSAFRAAFFAACSITLDRNRTIFTCTLSLWWATAVSSWSINVKHRLVREGSEGEGGCSKASWRDVARTYIACQRSTEHSRCGAPKGTHRAFDGRVVGRVQAWPSGGKAVRHVGGCETCGIAVTTGWSGRARVHGVLGVERSVYSVGHGVKYGLPVLPMPLPPLPRRQHQLRISPQPLFFSPPTSFPTLPDRIAPHTSEHQHSVLTSVYDVGAIGPEQVGSVHRIVLADVRA